MKKAVAIFLVLIMASTYLPYGYTADQVAHAESLAAVHDFGKETGLIRVVELDATLASQSGIAGIAAADAPVEEAADLPVKIRFGAAGKLEAADGDSWRADADFSYETGKSYHLKFVVNLPMQTYDVWATAPSGQPVLIGADLRTDGELTDIGKAYSLAEGGTAPSVANARVIPNAFTSKKDLAPNNTTFDIESDNSLTGRSYSVNFDIRLTGDPTVTDALIALSDSKIDIPPATWGNLSYIVQVNGNKFNVRDDNAYRQEKVVVPESGIDYHVSFVFEPGENGQPTRTFDVWLAKIGETPVQLADNYKIRNFVNPTQFPSDNINKIVVNSASDGLLLLKNLVVLDGDRLKQKVSVINAATDAATVRAALESNALGLPLDKYALMKEEAKAQVAQDILDARPEEGGYANGLAVQSVFENSVANRRDTEPPTSPGNPTVEISNSLQAVISWEASQDDTEIQYYKVYRDGVEIQHVVNGTTAVDTDIQRGRSYTYTIKAFDLVLKEAESVPVQATAPDGENLVYFPFSYSALSIAFGQGLLGYSLEPIPASQNPNNQKYVMEWRPENEGPAYAMQLLTIAAMHDPDYLGPDGVTTVTQRALEQFRSVLTPGKEPGLSGSGLSGQGYMPVLQSFLLAKHKVPAIWNELSAAEKSKIDLMMLTGFLSAKFTYDTENDYKRALDNSDVFDKNWNPNHRAGLIGAILAYYYFDGDTAWLNEQADNFDYDSWIQQLENAGLPNVKVVYGNLGKATVEQGIKRDSNNDGFTYTYDIGAGNVTVPLNQPGRLAKALTEITFRHPVSPIGQVENGERKGYMVDGYAEFPNLGASSMGFEHITFDAQGVRSSNNYVFMGWKPNIEAVLPIMLFERPESDITEQELQDLLIRLDIGTTDLIYKNTHGYVSYAKGKSEGVVTLNPIQLSILSDTYYSVVNNPQAPLANANSVQSAAQMRTVLESADLALVLWGYNALTDESKTKVAQQVLNARPDIGFRNKKAVQDALYDAVRVQALDAVNRATNAAEITSALKSRALGLYIPEYDAATTALKEQTLQYLLENRPAGGYPNKQLLLDMVKEGVLPQGNQLKNLPKLPTGETRFDLAEYDKWPEQYGEAKVALWKDDKVGAFSFSIDDNYYNQIDDWLELVEPYGFKLTWFLIGDKIEDNQIPKCAQLLADGHDLAAHSYYHGYNASRDGNLTKDEFTRREFEWTNDRINSIPGANVKSYALPGGINFPADKGFNYSLLPDYYSLARGGQNWPDYANSVNYLAVNLLSHPASSEINHIPGANSVENMVMSVIDPNVTVWNQRYYRGWSNMFAHSITEVGKPNRAGETHTTKEMAAAMFEMLDEHKDKIWYDHFTNVGLYAQERDTARVLTLVNAPDRIELNLTDRMADDIFDQPLTLKVRVDESWSQISAMQNGEAVPAKLVQHEGQPYVYVDAVPDKGRVVLLPYATTPLMIVNAANTTEQILQALADPELGLELGEFNTLDDRKKGIVGNRILAIRPVDGFANTVELQDAFAAAVAEAKNAPPLSANANLSDLKVNGITIAGFSPETYEYNVTLPEGTTALPEVGFKAADIGKATAVLENAAALPGTAKVTVTAEDKLTVTTYTIRFQVRIPALQWVNTAANAATVRTAIENSALGLVLDVYNSLTEAQKNSMASAVLTNRPTGGYADASAVQAALNAAIPTINLSRLAYSVVKQSAPADLYTAGWLNLYGGTGSNRKEGIYLKYDIAALAGLNADAIGNASVKIFGKNPGSVSSLAAIAYASPDNWAGDRQLTWNNQPLTDLKNGNMASLTEVGRVIVSSSASANYYINITPYLKDAIAADKTELSLVILSSENKNITLENIPGTIALSVTLAASGEPNPVPSPLAAVNEASDAAAIQTAISVAELDLNLTAYNGLTAEQRTAVAQALLNNRPEGGYANALAVQTKLNEAVAPFLEPELTPLEAVNLAATTGELQQAIAVPELGLDLAAYNALKPVDKVLATQQLLENRPTEGFASVEALQDALDSAVEAATPTPLEIVNGASSIAELRVAILQTELGLSLVGYNALTPSLKYEAAAILLGARPTEGFADIAALQAALDAAVAALQLPVATAVGTLVADAEELQPRQGLELTVGVSEASSFTGADIIVHYDPGVLEFATDEVEGIKVLKDEAIESLQGNYQVAAAIHGEPGTLRVLLFTAGSGQELAGTAPLFKLRASVKENAQTDVSTAVSLSDFELTFEGEASVWPDTTEAAVSLMIVARPVEADKGALIAAIAHAQSLLDGATVGPNPGQYSQAAYDALEDAIELAEETRDLAGVSQSVVDEAVAALGTAVQQFLNAVIPSTPGEPANFAALNAAIAKAQKLHDDGPYGDKIGQYPQSAKTALKSALDAAKAVQGNSSSSQESVNAAAASLNGAIQTFESALITLVGGGATKVGIRDLSMIAKYYGITNSDPNWNKVSAADIEGQNEITIEVLAAVARMILTDWATGE
jgi:peptidoglycan/xylan/chitin deacetylase (PgdA/CDA1 family)